MPDPAVLVRQRIDELLVAAADPSSHERPRPGVYSPLEASIAEWLRFVPREDQGPSIAVEHPGDRTRLRVMLKQLLVLEAAAELSDLVDGRAPRITVHAQGPETCTFQIDFGRCSLQGSLSPQVDEHAYDLGFWPNDLALDPDPVHRYLDAFDGLEAAPAAQRLQKRLGAHYSG